MTDKTAVDLGDLETALNTQHRNWDLGNDKTEYFMPGRDDIQLIHKAARAYLSEKRSEPTKKPIADWKKERLGNAWHPEIDARPHIPEPTGDKKAAITDGALLAQRFHETYEKLAPSFGYETRKESAKPWEEVPEQNKNLMIAVCSEIIRSTRGSAMMYATDMYAHLGDSKRFSGHLNAIRVAVSLQENTAPAHKWDDEGEKCIKCGDSCYNNDPICKSASDDSDLVNLIQCMMDNDPNDIISDGGHTVYDLWKYDAQRLLAAHKQKTQGGVE